MRNIEFSELQAMLENEESGLIEDVEFTGKFYAFSTNLSTSVFCAYNGRMTLKPIEKKNPRENAKYNVSFGSERNSSFSFEQRGKMEFDSERLRIFIPTTLLPQSCVSFEPVSNIKY